MPLFLRLTAVCILILAGSWFVDSFLGLRILVGGLLMGGLVLFRVTTRRDQAAMASLAQQKDLYQALVESSPQCLIVHQDFNIRFVNQYTLDFFNLPELGDHLGTPIFNFIPPEHHARVREVASQVLAGKNPQPSEVQVRRLDGQAVDIRSTAAKVFWNGEPAVLTVFSDITEELARRREFNITGERLQLALDAAQDGVWDRDMTTGKMVYNEAWAAMLGYSLDEISDHLVTWHSLIHPDDLSRAKDRLTKHLEGLTPGYECEVRLQHKDGHYIWVLDRGKIVERDASGQPLRMTGTHRNITARKVAEHALEVRNRVAEAFLTHETGTLFPRIIEVVNQSLDAPIGLLATLTPQGVLKVMIPTESSADNPATMSPQLTFQPDHFPEIFDKVIKHNQPVMINEPFSFPGHSVLLESVLGVPIARRDKELGAIFLGNKSGGFQAADLAFLESLAGYIAPILHAHLNSEAKEAQLRQIQKMEALGALAGGIAHDFNNILQAIMGFTSLALEDVGQEGNIPGDLERVMKAARRGQELVNRIQLFSRRDEQEHMALDIQAVVLEAIDLLTPTIPATIEIRSHLEAEGARIIGDPGQISQVILNLATNALHAMEPGEGVLEFHLGICDGSESQDGCPKNTGGQEMVALSISDSGKGMGDEIKDRVFDPFFTTKEVGQGTGLGLSVVHGIVQSHLGQIIIESELDKGTTVRIFLPSSTRDVPPAALEEAVPHSQDFPGGRKIVILDDEEDITRIGKALLEKLGHRVTAESNGRHLLETLAKDPYLYDLVITDLTMPQITGLQLAESLDQIRSDLPIILITGISGQKGINLESHQNIKGLIRKPFGGAVLRQTVDRVLKAEGFDSCPES